LSISLPLICICHSELGSKTSFCANDSATIDRNKLAPLGDVEPEAGNERGQRRQELQAEIDTADRQIAAIIAAVKDGLYHPSMKAEMTRLEERRKTLDADNDVAVGPLNRFLGQWGIPAA
jgi:hypothetical protein